MRGPVTGLDLLPVQAETGKAKQGDADARLGKLLRPFFRLIVVAAFQAIQRDAAASFRSKSERFGRAIAPL